ncbi:glycosyltransferase [Pseudactinotalea terrae]|uniref:glycosyltransferase n=1 Tax=Pseudactinotalea terrae TaxID=1743262 RepID=UPI0012E1F6E1|nr:glycosyltransferase [Pseudactinotalea terrae]
MRAAVVTRIYAPEVAAAAFRLGKMVSALARHGQVDVLTVIAAGEHHHPPAAVRVRRWPVLRDRSGYVRGYLPYLSFDVPLLLRLILMRKPTVFVVEPPPTTGVAVRIVCAVRRVPYAWYAADVWSDATASTGAPAIVTKVVRALESWVLKGAAVSLAVSEEVADRVRELGAPHVVTVGNGIDTEIFCPQGERLAGPRTFVYAGTASEWQGADVFARAMPQVLAAVPDARLVYLGHGSAWPTIGTVAASLPQGAVTMHASVPPERSAAWLRGAAAAVVSIVPGQGYDFALPTKLFAALGTGTPVIHAGVGAAADLVREHELGWVADHDVDAVAAAMIAALRAPDGEHERSRRAAWVAEHRSLAAAAERAAAAVVEAARGGSARRRGSSA